MTARNPAADRLDRLRRRIDRVDDAMLLALALRRRLVAAAAAAKQCRGVDAEDRGREAAILARAERLARRLGLPPALAHAQCRLAIADGRALQGLPPTGETMFRDDDPKAGAPAPAAPTVAAPLLRWFPPPRRWAPFVRALPPAWSARMLQGALARLLARPPAAGDLDFLVGRTIAIDVADLGLRWVLSLDGRELRVVAGPGVADATVRAGVADLLALAGRRADADTLFFQRRLEMTGDTELGLTARNLLDRLPWETVPLAARILLDRAARFAAAAREAQR